MLKFKDGKSNVTDQKLCKNNKNILSDYSANGHLTTYTNNIRASTCDFQQCDILTSVDSDEPVKPPFELRNSK